MKLKIAVVASGPLIAGEITSIIKAIISEDIESQTYLTEELTDYTADIYICAQTQLKSLLKVVPQEKIVLLDLMPNLKFFMAVSRIPENKSVYIFNNYLEYTSILANYCRDLGINGVEFIPVAYRDMPQEEVFSHLQKAEYIIGVDRVVGEDGLLSHAYRAYLRKDVTIIPATRAASVHSACMLIKCIAAKYHSHINNAIEKIKSDLKNPQADLHKTKLELHNLAVYVNKSIDIIQNAVTKSVLNNISSDIAIWTTCSNRLDIKLFANQPVSGMLAMIEDSNRVLHLITEKLTKL